MNTQKIPQDKIDFIIENFSKMTRRELSEKIKVSTSFIGKIGKKYKLKSLYANNIKTYLLKNNSNLLEIKKLQNKHIIYCLGFLWGDGYLYKRKEKYSTIRMGIIKSDFENIQSSFLFLGKANSYTVDTKKENYQIQTHWILSDVLLAEFLFENDYHVKSFSSPYKILNKIPVELQSYFWRGFFDADGHLQIKNEKPKSVFFGGQVSHDWAWEIDFFEKMNINFKVYKRYKECGNVSIFTISKQEYMMKFLNYIYKDRESDNIGLYRKYEKYLIIKNMNYHIRTSKEKFIFYCRFHKKWKFSMKIQGKYIIQRTFNSEQEAILFRDNWIVNNQQYFDLRK